jgi:hypothetical protein
MNKDTRTRLQKLVDMLSKSDKEFVDDYNKENPNEYSLKYGDSYAYLCGWVRSELEWILKEAKR